MSEGQTKDPTVISGGMIANAIECLKKHNMYGLADEVKQMQRQRATLLDDISCARQSLYKVAEQRNTLLCEGGHLIELLRAAKCPNCDGSGCYIRDMGSTHDELQQCQWCFERNAACVSEEQCNHGVIIGQFCAICPNGNAVSEEQNPQPRSTSAGGSIHPNQNKILAAGCPCVVCVDARVEPHAWVNQGTCCRKHATSEELMTRMIVCPKCGDKRCPRAESCETACQMAERYRHAVDTLAEYGLTPPSGTPMADRVLSRRKRL